MRVEILWVMEAIRHRTVGIFVFALAILWLKKFQGRNRRQRRWCLLDRIPGQIRNMNELNGEKGKASRGRRTWLKIEEDALIQCLTDIVNNGWKAGNGFKSGFQRELKKGIKKLLPGTDLVVNPHIKSKIHVWKKEHGSLFDLFSKSGIGWNCTTNTIDVLDEEA
ncbi:hypothetical protein ACS0TY_011627 [Phlomoides rotata]